MTDNIKIDLNELTMLAIKASIDAGKEILNIYDTDYSIEHKEDNSPLTQADKASHEIIANILSSTEIPVLSEEGKSIPFNERKDWNYFWIVDPLDGTKEFIKRNGEFTVNIALAHLNKPITGVIYVPVLDILYFALPGHGAFKMKNASISTLVDSLEEMKRNSIKLPQKFSKKKYSVVASRSHLNEETKAFIDSLTKKHGEVDIVSSGSSLKFCLVAEGKAHIYPRFAPTMEWDTAAGQAIAENAGSKVMITNLKEPLAYNKEDLLNPGFIVL